MEVFNEFIDDLSSLVLNNKIKIQPQELFKKKTTEEIEEAKEKGNHQEEFSYFTYDKDNSNNRIIGGIKRSILNQQDCEKFTKKKKRKNEKIIDDKIIKSSEQTTTIKSFKKKIKPIESLKNKKSKQKSSAAAATNNNNNRTTASIVVATSKSVSIASDSQKQSTISADSISSDSVDQENYQNHKLIELTANNYNSNNHYDNHSTIDEVHARYQHYLTLERELKDKFKTDFTYAHSYSYSPLVSVEEQFDWKVPNMSRQSIRHRGGGDIYSENIFVRRYMEDVPVSQFRVASLSSSTNHLEKNSIESEGNTVHRITKTTKFQVMSSKQLSQPNEKHNSLLELSDDDNEVDGIKLRTRTTRSTKYSQQQPVAALNKKKSTIQSNQNDYIDYDDDDDDDDDGDDNTQMEEKSWWLRRYFIRTVRYLPLFSSLANGHDVYEEKINSHNQKGFSSTPLHTYNLRSRRFVQNDDSFMKRIIRGKSSLKWFLWLVLFLLPLLFFAWWNEVSFSSYSSWPAILWNNVQEIPSQISSSLTFSNWPNWSFGTDWSSWFGRFRFLPALTLFGGQSSSAFKNPSLSDLNADLLFKQNQDSNIGQQQQQPPQNFVPTSQMNELLSRLALLETRLSSCCQSANASAYNQWTKDDIEKHISHLVNSQVDHVKSTLLNVIDEHYGFLNSSLVNQIKSEFEIRMKDIPIVTTITPTLSTSAYDGHDIQRMIQKALAKYDADKTGEADFALESAGAYIISTRCSESYQLHTGTYKVLGIPIWRSINTPREIIHSNVVPGQCWCFKGSEGRVAIKLATRIIPTAFAYEHIPVRLSRDGHIFSAPNRFVVYGLKSVDDQDPVILGEYDYYIVNNPDKEIEEPLQRFPVQNMNVAKQTFDMVEVVVKSNHGNPEYTCLYRFRVHGKLPVSNS